MRAAAATLMSMAAVSRSRPGDRYQVPVDPAISTVMTSMVVAVLPDTTLVDALRVMDSARVRHLPVIEHDQCVGLLSEIDVLRRLVAQGLTRPGPTARLTAGAVCRRPVPAIAARGSRAAAADAMLTSGSDAVLVLEGGLVLGIVTAFDLAASLVAHTVPDQCRGG